MTRNCHEAALIDPADAVIAATVFIRRDTISDVPVKAIHGDLLLIFRFRLFPVDSDGRLDVYPMLLVLNDMRVVGCIEKPFEADTNK